MKILAISGTYRKGKTIDSLVEQAISAIKTAEPSAETETISLIDKKIEYCKNCMVCKEDDPEKSHAHCIIDDDMTEIYRKLDEADGYIFGTPVNIGTVTALLKAFIERSCWVMAKPGKAYPCERFSLVKGCPMPRTTRKKFGVIIVSAGLVPPALRMFCDMATPLIRDYSESCLGGKIIGDMYAGNVQNKGVESYFEKARKLGLKLLKAVKNAQAIS